MLPDKEGSKICSVRSNVKRYINFPHGYLRTVALSNLHQSQRIAVYRKQIALPVVG